MALDLCGANRRSLNESPIQNGNNKIDNLNDAGPESAGHRLGFVR